MVRPALQMGPETDSDKASRRCQGRVLGDHEGQRLGLGCGVAWKNPRKKPGSFTPGGSGKESDSRRARGAMRPTQGQGVLFPAEQTNRPFSRSVVTSPNA